MPFALTDAQRLKLALLADGLQISSDAAAALSVLNGDRALTPADYASTSGVILRLEGDVWVNAPYPEHNPNFVKATRFALHHDAEGFFVEGGGFLIRAEFWTPPLYHGTLDANGRPVNNYAFTHGDRARVAPIMGCAMTCTFCNIPYEDGHKTEQKPIEALLSAARVALSDPQQPAHHLLISGGTPRRRDIPYLQNVYETVLKTFPDVDIDIMMVPVEGLFDLPTLDALGLGEISINLEVFDVDLGRDLMPQKHLRGRDYYLSFLEEAAGVLGHGRVRSMLMVGIEPVESTLEGVRSIVDRGCVPVLSPFRPDPATPMVDAPPPSAQLLEEVFHAAKEIAEAAGTTLGPTCLPCMHNTLTFAPDTGRPASYQHPLPALV